MKQIWLRHRRGGGKKFGNDCEVSDDTYLDRGSSVGDRAQVFNAVICNSILADDALVCGYPSPISITDCEIAGNTRVWQYPSLHDVSLRNVSVFGDAVVEGFSLDAHVRIHAGLWTRAPRHALITGPGIEVTVSECVPGFMHVGCRCEPFRKWANAHYRYSIGQHAGWSPQMVEKCFSWFEKWA